MSLIKKLPNIGHISKIESELRDKILLVMLTQWRMDRN